MGFLVRPLGYLIYGYGVSFPLSLFFLYLFLISFAICPLFAFFFLQGRQLGRAIGPQAGRRRERGGSAREVRYTTISLRLGHSTFNIRDSSQTAAITTATTKHFGDQQGLQMESCCLFG